MQKKTLIWIICFLLIAALAAGGCGAKQDKYPSKPITLIINYGMGGATDISARLLAKEAEKILGQPIVVVNKQGGDGAVGLAELAKAKPDGYTIGTSPYGAVAIAPHTREVGFNPLKDFDFLLSYGQYQYGIVVKSDTPYKNIQDLVQAAKAKPDQITYGDTGFPHTLAMVGLEKLQGVKFNRVPFKSGAESASALLGGHIEVAVQNVSDVVGYLKSGEMRLLAASGDKRWDEAPEVSTMKEQGYDVTVSSYLAFAAPKGLPNEVKDKLVQAFQKASEDPQFKESMKKFGLLPKYQSGSEYEQIVKKGYEDVGNTIKELGLQK